MVERKGVLVRAVRERVAVTVLVSGSGIVAEATAETDGVRESKLELGSDVEDIVEEAMERVRVGFGN